MLKKTKQKMSIWTKVKISIVPMRLVQETNHHIKILVEMIQVQIFNKEQWWNINTRVHLQMAYSLSLKFVKSNCPCL